METTALLGIIGALITALGYGTPSSAVITTNLAGTAVTTAQIGGTLSALILELQTLGILGR